MSINYPAIVKAPRRLSTASFLASAKGTCEPVTITVFPKFSSINERAEAVNGNGKSYSLIKLNNK